MSLLESPDVLIMIVIFLAALIQAAGGMGFGLIAAPVLVAALGPTAGIQAAILLNILVALVAWGIGRKEVRYDLLMPMMPGALAGLFIGMAISLLVPAMMIKVALCAALVGLCFLPQKRREEARSRDQSLPVLSGIMGAALAMPGPAAAVYLRGRTETARSFRSSMMPVLSVIYLGAALGGLSVRGLEPAAINAFALDSQSAIAGLMAGLLVSKRLSEQLMVSLTKVLLLATASILVCTTASDLLAMMV